MMASQPRASQQPQFPRDQSSQSRRQKVEKKPFRNQKSTPKVLEKMTAEGNPAQPAPSEKTGAYFCPYFLT